MSALFDVQMRFFAHDDDNDPARFEQFLDDVVDAFAEQGYDVDYTAVASALEATFTIEVADGSESGLITALEAVRAAMKTVGVDLDSHEVMSTRKLALA